MPEEFDLPIDSEFDESFEDEPTPKKRRARTPVRKTATRRATPRRRVAIEEARHERPRISIEAATNTPRRVNTYRWLSLSFFGATLAVIGVIIFFTFQRASLAIAQEALPVAATFPIDVVDGGGATSTAALPANTFSGMVVSITTSTSRVFAPTATSEKPGKARGMVTITNNSGSSQALVATTRFLSEAGVLFRLSKGVTVPAGGEISAEIVADKPGAPGDIPPSSFTIPGLNAANQKLIFGKTATAMTGGSSKVGVVSQQDIDKAQEEARKALFEVGQQVLAAVKVPDTYATLHTPVAVKAETSVKPGDETSSFTVTARGTMAFVAYPKISVFAAADSEVQNHVPTPYHKVVFSNNAPTVSLQSISPETKTAKLQIYREGKAVLDARSNAFQPTQFMGRTKQEIVDMLTSIKGVKHVDISFFPFWVDHAPKVPSRIQVNIQEP